MTAPRKIIPPQKTGFFTAAILACLLVTGTMAQASQKGTFTVTDFQGRRVEIPARINRVVTISDGMIAGVMTCLGEAKKIVGIGSACLPKIWEYDIPSTTGASHEYRQGMNPVFFLNPFLADIPLVSQFGSGINFEAVAGLKPDLIIIRTGSCSLSYTKDILGKKHPAAGIPGGAVSGASRP